MLSKLATLILGILSEKERNPYDITKMLSEMNTRKWLPLADSTVYATINNLKKNSLINGRQERSGNLPEKTIYNITPEGEFELHNSITTYLEEDASTSTGFDIGILLMQNLSKPEILMKLKKKLERLERQGNFVRAASIAVTSVLGLVWLCVNRYDNVELYSHFITLCVFAATLMVWAAVREQFRWVRLGAPRLMRWASLFGTPGLFMLETGGIFWMISEREFLSERRPIW